MGPVRAHASDRKLSPQEELYNEQATAAYCQKNSEVFIHPEGSHPGKATGHRGAAPHAPRASDRPQTTDLGFFWAYFPKPLLSLRVLMV